MHPNLSATGRLVHNVIDGMFEFNEQGLITRVLLVWTLFLRDKVRQQATASLKKYRAQRKR